MKKRFFASMSAFLAAVVLLAGCAGTPALTTKDSPSQAAPASDEPVELDFYYPVAAGGPIASIMDGLCQRFSQENGRITVNPIYTGSYADTRTKIQSDMQAGTLPEVAIMFSTDLFSLLDMDAIVDVDSFLKTDEDKAFINDFYEGFMLNTQTGGKTWGVPFQRSTIILYYNKD
ncbi:MAG: extracellular solute-binding protein, partial [Acetanaerobacterium sp.]